MPMQNWLDRHGLDKSLMGTIMHNWGMVEAWREWQRQAVAAGASSAGVWG